MALWRPLRQKEKPQNEAGEAKGPLSPPDVVLKGKVEGNIHASTLPLKHRSLFCLPAHHPKRRNEVLV